MSVRASWRDRVELTVELGLRGVAVGGFVWDVSDWDEALWSGLEPEWVPLEGCEVARLSIRRGRNRGSGRHSTGTAEVELVWPTAGDRTSLRDSSPVQLGQELRVRAIVPDASDTPVPLYRGMVREKRDAGPVPARSG